MRICVICGQRGGEEEATNYFASRTPAWRTGKSDRTHRAAGSSCERLADPDPLGEIRHRDFSAAGLRCPHPDIFHGFRARNRDATPLGGGRILVLLFRRGPLADRLLRSAAADAGLRLWS